MNFVCPLYFYVVEEKVALSIRQTVEQNPYIMSKTYVRFIKLFATNRLPGLPGLTKSKIKYINQEAGACVLLPI